MLRIVRTVDDAAEFLRWLGERRPGVIAIDTETTGFDLFGQDFKVRIIQFGDTQGAWILAMEDWVGVIKQALTQYRGQFAVHNSRYDVAAISRHGIQLPWDRIDDTMIAMRLAEPTMSAGLKESSTRHVSAAAAMSQQDLHKAMHRNGWTWATIPMDFPPYLKYAGLDVILTSRLWETAACQRGMRSQVYDLEMQVRAICSRMEANGMRIDREFCSTTAIELGTKMDEIRAFLETTYSVSPSSSQQLAHFFMARGQMLTERTPTGAASMNKDQLAKLVHNSEDEVTVQVANAVLEYRKAEKLRSNYFEPFQRFAGADDVMHADIETVAARTGRMSIRNPALQTLPKPGESEESRLVRRGVIPLHDGELLVSSDYSQIEMRLIAVTSGDPALINAFNTADATGGDFFVEMGRVVFNDPGFTKADHRRKLVKNVMYGLAYGAGPAKIALTAGIPEAVARDVRAGILAGFPGLSRAMQKLEREARDSGGVTTMLGRELVVDPDKAYKGLNAYVQGSAADLMKRAIVQLGHAGLEPYMLVPVHDEVLFSIPVDEIEEAKVEIAKAMVINDTAVPVPADPSDGLLTWGDDK